VTDGAARIKLGLSDKLLLGNLDAKRDWGFAGDYMEVVWLMLQQPEPVDYVISSGQNHSVRDLVEIAFSYVGLDWKKYVQTDPRFVRPAEVDVLLGDSSLAHKKLGWKPKTSFEHLVKMMVDADMERIGPLAKK